MLAEQIIKRKKQWTFIKRIRACICEMWPVSGLITQIYETYSIRISINGKVNGRDRSIAHLMQRLHKDKQIIKFC